MLVERTFELPTFVDAIGFVNRVADLAEARNHHPDLAIHYRRVTVRWWTHTAGGITDATASSRPRRARSSPS